jgi:hypothetical protein
MQKVEGSSPFIRFLEGPLVVISLVGRRSVKIVIGEDLERLGVLGDDALPNLMDPDPLYRPARLCRGT